MEPVVIPSADPPPSLMTPSRMVLVAVAALLALALALVLVTVLVSGRARAEEAAKPLTVQECLTVLAGLNGLDGRTELTKDGTPVQVPYQFGSARLRMAIQQNIARLTDLQNGITKVQQDMFREVAGSATEIKPNTPEMVRYQKMVLDAQQQPCSVNLQRIKADDLKLDKNEVPGSVLGALDKILDR